MRIIVAFLLVLSFGGCALASDAVGEVETSVPQSWAQRDGEKSELAAGDKIFVSDIVATDKAGRIGVSFEDGTSVALGPNAEAVVKEFVMTDAKNKFETGILKGAARVITGDLVKRNPNGFKVTTPRATVGIRGTTLVFGVGANGNETISVTDIGDSSHVTIISASGRIHRINAAGYSYVAPAGMEGVVVPNNDAINQLIEQLIAAIESGTATDIEVEELLKLVFEEAEREIDEKSVSENELTPGGTETSEEAAEKLITPNQRKEVNITANTKPSPRRTGCD